MMLDTTTCLPFIAAGKLKALAVASKQRNPALPNVADVRRARAQGRVRVVVVWTDGPGRHTPGDCRSRQCGDQRHPQDSRNAQTRWPTLAPKSAAERRRISRASSPTRRNGTRKSCAPPVPSSTDPDALTALLEAAHRATDAARQDLDATPHRRTRRRTDPALRRLHLLQDGSAPAFEMLRGRGLAVHAPRRTFGTPDHYVPTHSRDLGDLGDPEKRTWPTRSRRDTRRAGITLFGLDDPRQGIVHVVGPEQGSPPGMVIVCGDSHTSTHGALGALAFGIGTSEVAHVLATQSLWQRKPKTLRIAIDGPLAAGVTPKDVILAIIARIGAAGATGHVIEYAGSTIDATVDGRPAHHLQHVDRSRRTRRHGRAGRHDLRIPGGPAVCAQRRRMGRRVDAVAQACAPTPGRRSTAKSALDGGDIAADGDLGHEPRGCGCRSPGTFPIRRRSATPSGGAR